MAETEHFVIDSRKELPPRQSRWAIAGALLAAIIPFFGVALLGWDAASVLAFFFAEWAIVILLGMARMPLVLFGHDETQARAEAALSIIALAMLGGGLGSVALLMCAEKLGQDRMEAAFHDTNTWLVALPVLAVQGFWFAKFAVKREYQEWNTKRNVAYLLLFSLLPFFMVLYGGMLISVEMNTSRQAALVLGAFAIRAGADVFVFQRILNRRYFPSIDEHYPGGF